MIKNFIKQPIRNHFKNMRDRVSSSYLSKEHRIFVQSVYIFRNSAPSENPPGGDKQIFTA